MKGKENPLMAAAKSVEKEIQPEMPVEAVQKKKQVKPSREGTRLIAGHFPPEVLKQLRFISVEEDVTQNVLLGQALDLLFVQKGKKAICNMDKV